MGLFCSPGDQFAFTFTDGFPDLEDPKTREAPRDEAKPLVFELLPRLQQLVVACTERRPTPRLLRSASVDELLSARVPGVRFTLLEMAARCGQADIVRVLLERVPGLVRVGCPCVWAAYTGQIVILRTLIASGADLQTPCADGDTALHYAANNWQLETVKVLCEELHMSVLSTNARGLTAFDAVKEAGVQ